VERFGSAAPDTVMELCAVLEISQDALVIAEDADPFNPKGVSLVVVLAMMLLTLIFGIVVGVLAMAFLL